MAGLTLLPPPSSHWTGLDWDTCPAFFMTRAGAGAGAGGGWPGEETDNPLSPPASPPRPPQVSPVSALGSRASQSTASRASRQQAWRRFWQFQNLNADISFPLENVFKQHEMGNLTMSDIADSISTISTCGWRRLMGMFGLIQNFELFPARDTRYYKIYHIAVQSEHHLTSSLNSKFQFE